MESQITYDLHARQDYIYIYLGLFCYLCPLLLLASPFTFWKLIQDKRVGEHSALPSLQGIRFSQQEALEEIHPEKSLSSHPKQPCWPFLSPVAEPSNSRGIREQLTAPRHYPSSTYCTGPAGRLATMAL